MFRLNKNKITFYIFGILSLFIGGIIYIVFRENTYISKLFNNYIFVSKLKNHLPFLDNNFIKYYFPDYLWAFSLSNGLHIIYLPNFKNSLLCTLVVWACGTIYELLQFLNIVSGTYDIIDILM